MMEKAKYFAITLIFSALIWGTVFWISVPYVADNTGLYLKKPSYVEFFIGFISIAVGRVLFDYVNTNIRVRNAGSNNSSKGIARALIWIGIAIFYISLARIGLPFLSSVTDIHIPKAKSSEFIFWFVLLALGTSIYWFGIWLRRSCGKGKDLISRLRSKFVDPSADDILAKDPRPPILYLRSFNKELGKAAFRGRLSRRWRGAELEANYIFWVCPT
jgi:hypothetical protein